MIRTSAGPVIALWMLSMGAPAAAPGQDLDLAELERRALESAPRIVAQRERVAALEARARGTGYFDDPMLEVEAMDLLPTGGRPLEAVALLRQPLPPLGRRSAERAVADAERAAAESDLATAERELRAELRRGWAEVWELQAERALLEEAHPLLELVVESATARIAGSSGSIRSVFEARLLLRRHEIDQEQVEARWLEAQSRLAELAGLSGRTLFPRVGELPELPSLEVELDAGAASSPRVLAAENRLALAAARLEATKLERRLGSSVGVGLHSYEGESAELIVRAGIELPIFRFRRVGPRIEAAEHEVAAATAELERERNAVRGELERLYLERVSAERQLVRVTEGLLPESDATFEAARSALLDGSGSVAEAATALQMWVEARIEESRLRASRFATRAGILSLVSDELASGGKP